MPLMIERFCSGGRPRPRSQFRWATNPSERAILLQLDHPCSSLPPKDSLESAAGGYVNLLSLCRLSDAKRGNEIEGCWHGYGQRQQACPAKNHAATK